MKISELNKKVNLFGKHIYLFILSLTFFSSFIGSLSWKKEFSFIVNAFDFQWRLTYILLFILFLLELFYIFDIKKNKKEIKQRLIIIGIGLLACALIVFFSKDYQMCIYILLAVFSRYLKKDELIKTFLLSKGTGFIVLTIALLFDMVTHGTIRDGSYALGFVHYNVAGFNIIYFILFFSFFLYEKNESLFLHLLLLVAMTLMWIIIKSRTACLIIIIFILLLSIIKLFEDQIFNSQFIKLFLSFIPFLLMIFSIIMGYLFVKKFILVDENFMFRFKEGYMALKRYGFSFYSRDFSDLYYINDIHYVFDNSYIRLLFSYGFSEMLIVLLLLSKGLEKLFVQKNIYLLTLLLCILIHATMEWVFMNEAAVLFILFINCKKEYLE